ncbi:MAG: hypothetical protein TUN42_02505 [Dehalogenimonas sp.]
MIDSNSPLVKSIRNLIGAAPTNDSYESKQKITIINSSVLGVSTFEREIQAWVDIPNNKIHLKEELKTTGTQKFKQSSQDYFIGELNYFKSNNREMNRKTWYWRKIPNDNILEIAKFVNINQQVQTYLDLALVELLGEESTQGVVCLKVRVTPNKCNLLKFLSIFKEINDTGLNNPELTIKQTDIFVWVDKLEYTPVRHHFEVAFAQKYGTITVNLDSTFSRINEPVNITLPKDADAAIEFK